MSSQTSRCRARPGSPVATRRRARVPAGGSKVCLAARSLNRSWRGVAARAGRGTAAHYYHPGGAKLFHRQADPRGDAGEGEASALARARRLINARDKFPSVNGRAESFQTSIAEARRNGLDCPFDLAVLVSQSAVKSGIVKARSSNGDRHAQRRRPFLRQASGDSDVCLLISVKSQLEASRLSQQAHAIEIPPLGSS